MFWPGRRRRRGCSGRRAAAHLSGLLVGAAFEEQPGEQAATATSPTGPSAPLRVQERPKPSPESARLGNRVSAPMRSAANWSSEMELRKPRRRSGCGRGGQETEDGIVRMTDVRVRQAGDDREVAAEVLEHFQVRRERIVLAGLVREEVRRVQTERGADADHAAGRCGTLRRRGAFEPRKASDTPAARRKLRREGFTERSSSETLNHRDTEDTEKTKGS